MKFLSAVFAAAAPPPRAPGRESDDAMRISDRRIVMTQSSGNVWLQTGKYSTREDIDEQYRRVVEAWSR